MNLDELLESLRKLELRLRSPEVQAYVMNLPDPQMKARFVSARQEVSYLLEKLANATLANIAAKLEELSAPLQAGIRDLNANLSALNNAAAILDTMETVLGLVARIAVLAAGA